MTLIEWDDRFSVNVQEIDEHHKKLVAMINRLNGLREEKAEQKAAEEVLMEMTDYLDYHFSAEEQYMVEFDYPGYKAHREEHKFFVKKVFEFLRGFREGRESLSNDMLHFLKDWLIKHIISSDAKFAPCLMVKVLT